ncbi:O-antigen ligase [Paenibacillus sp. 1011MAR3C5]|uniref:O-antigen ligase family protein n=1 Tax=Paenibacillus sp. 1011MAR3C5 TaxID=1675787 RepID=UPI0016028AA3|nr:O-antigen ligase family protein [Paenibacillus sp. 1011MAR3C5]
MQWNQDVVNPNQLAILVFILSYFSLIYSVGFKTKSKYKLFSLITLAVLFFTGSRTALLCAAFVILTVIIWKRITRSKFLFNFYFVSIAIFGFIVTVVYPNLYKILPNFDVYNYYMIKYTGKSINSGRDQIWGVIGDIVMNKPFFGHGAGAIPVDFTNWELSSHNQFLQIALQVGLVGLAILILVLFLIWNQFWKNRNDKRVMLTASYFIGIIVYQLFEVTLTHNATASVIQWMILGLGLSFAWSKSPSEN